MGIIGEVAQQGRQRIQDLEAQQRIDTDASITATLDQMTDVLAEDQFLGDVDTAFIHHFGREAFDKGWAVEKVQKLIARIDAEDMNEVPVVLTTFDEYGTMTTHIFIADSGNVLMQSAKCVQPNVKMHAFASEAADVTVKTLGLEGPTVTLGGTLLSARTTTENEGFPISTSKGFELSRLVTADRAGSSMPSEYAFSNEAWDIFDQLGNPIVGWKDLEKSILSSIPLEDTHTALRHYRRLLPRVGLWRSAIKGNMPRLHQAIEALDAYDRSVGDLVLGAIATRTEE